MKVSAIKVISARSIEEGMMVSFVSPTNGRIEIIEVDAVNQVGSISVQVSYFDAGSRYNAYYGRNERVTVYKIHA